MLISYILPSTGGRGSEQRHFNSQADEQDSLRQGLQIIIITRATKSKSKKHLQHGVRMGLQQLHTHKFKSDLTFSHKPALFPLNGTEVGDGWAPGLDSWCFSTGVKLKLCFPQTLQGQKLSCAEGDKMTTPEIKEDFPVCTCAGRLLRGHKGRGHHPIIGAVKLPIGFHLESVLAKKICTHIGKGPRTGQVQKRNKMIGQR